MRYREIIEGTTAEKAQKAAQKRARAQQKFTDAQRKKSDAAQRYQDQLRKAKEVSGLKIEQIHGKAPAQQFTLTFAPTQPGPARLQAARRIGNQRVLHRAGELGEQHGVRPVHSEASAVAR